ncbi:Zip-domain-containing protein [Terfezia boudieri ATCC MYA-4762]|uniref:Zip-domain-containing protein n=1 Tax=Terfezia boudieri ATCC MYA-4762 TaxID=1051890 RepID=A0A3N4LLT5_9PEZI|nr:Zip-domain-containing protein [Terfezia boudieri ATCC MYA-4762]
MAYNTFEGRGRVPSCLGCLRKVTIGLVLATCLLFVTSIEARTDCYVHGTERWCIGPDGKKAIYPTVSGRDVETTYTDCHSHFGVTYCTNSRGEEVPVTAEDLANGTDDHDDDHDHDTSENTQCVVSKSDYNKKLRIGTIFIVLVTSAIAVFGPILLSKVKSLKYDGLVFTTIKQFGTGVIIATAFIHLLTHAQILFTNPCIGHLKFEATASAIAMAGIFSAFLVEYVGDRILQIRAKNKQTLAIADLQASEAAVGKDDTGSEPHVHNHVHTHSHGAHSHGPAVNDKLSVLVMEAGIIFHSILIGIALIVSDDAVFATLLAVVIFHQMFEGLALGTRIALLPTACASLTVRLLLALAFAVITPIGMAIGVGVLNKFNGNDKHTLVAIATLNALSAGILVWVGAVEMWAADWLNGYLKVAGPAKTAIALVSLISGMVLMGLLGKWA